MPRFFVTDDAFRDGTVTISGQDAHHISKSLRMAAGEHITVCGPDGTEYDCTLKIFGEDFIKAEMTDASRSAAEPLYRVSLYQAMPKSDKLEFIIQKAVELGAASITPFISSRCVSRPDGTSLIKKRERYQKIALEAAKQCQRAAVPQIMPCVSFKEMTEKAAAAALALFCYEGGGTRPLKEALRSFKGKTGDAEISVVVGPEGGFSPEEAESAKKAGFIMSGLGKRILRCETAPLYALSCIAYELESPGTSEDKS